MRSLGSLALACALIACSSHPATPPDASPSDAASAPDAVPAPDAAAPAPDAAAIDAVPVALCDPADPALVACFGFEDTTDDGSGAALSLVATNVAFAPGVHGRALATTAESLLRVAETPALDVAAFTIELWMGPTLVSDSVRAGLFDNNGQYGLFLLPGGGIRCSGGGDAVEVAGVATVESWTHVACTHDGQTITVYIHGLVAATGPGGALGTGGSDGSSIAGDSPSGDPFTGRIDDLRIWNRVRSADEICAAAACRQP